MGTKNRNSKRLSERDELEAALRAGWSWGQYCWYVERLELGEEIPLLRLGPDPSSEQAMGQND